MFEIPEHILPTWDSSPAEIPSGSTVDAPVMGNGAVAAAVGSTPGLLTFFLDRNDAWVPATGDISACGYDIDKAGARTVGGLTLAFNGGSGFSAQQIISNGTITTSMPTALGGTLKTASFIVRGVDVLVTDVWWDFEETNSTSSLSVHVTAGKGGSSDAFCHTFDSGSSPQMTWSSRQLGYPYQNIPTSTIGRRHFYKSAWAARAITNSNDNSMSDVMCTDFDGRCDICRKTNDTRSDWASPCLYLNGSAEAGHTCVPSKWWAMYHGKYPHVGPCLTCNSTDCTAAPSPPGLNILLAPNGRKSTIVTAVLSNFDDTNNSYTDPVLPAQELVTKAVATPSIIQAWRSKHRNWWQEFWNQSWISLPTAPELEAQWYGSLYILASSHRTAEDEFEDDSSRRSNALMNAVAPGIVWPKTNDEVAFRGAMTMNYNQGWCVDSSWMLDWLDLKVE